MGKSTKPRKAFKQVAKRMPIVFGMRPEEKTELAVAPLLAINMFISGLGNEDLAYTIINNIVIGYKLARDEQDRAVFVLGSDAMRRVLSRGSHNKWGFSGDDLKDIRAAVTLSDELQTNATRRQMKVVVNAILSSADSGG